MSAISLNIDWYKEVYTQGQGAIVNCRWPGVGYSQVDELEDEQKAFDTILSSHQIGKEAAEHGFDNVPVGSFFSAVAYMYPSAYGCPIINHNGLTITRPKYQSVDDLEQFAYIPQGFEHGFFVYAFDRIEKFQNTYPDILLTVSDTQSPIDIVTEIFPMEKMLLLMYDRPELVHKVLSAVTQTIIDVNHHFAKTINNFGGYASGAYLPFGIHLSDDNAAFLSPEIYNEFARPYADRLSDEFGGVTFHVCMKFEQNLKSLAGVKGFIGFDAMPYYNDPQLILDALDCGKVWNVYDYSFSRPMGELESPEQFYMRLIDLNENRNAMKFDIWHEDRESSLKLADFVKNYASKKGMKIK